jgi:hypothetical protein
MVGTHAGDMISEIALAIEMTFPSLTNWRRGCQHKYKCEFVFTANTHPKTHHLV